MDEVAKKLDMKKASIYYHFPSKEKMFLEVMEFSFLKYKAYLEEILNNSEINEILLWIISYPIGFKNLFSVVSQKWYCKIGVIRDFITLKNKELFQILYWYFHEKHWFSEEKTVLLQSLLDDLCKKYCIFDCKETLDSNKLIPEITKIFFTNPN